MAAPKVSLKAKLLLASVLAWVAGFTDVISFLDFHSYASMMTGNLIQLARFGSDTNLHGWSVDEESAMPTAVFIILIITVNMLGIVTYHAAEATYKYGTTLIAPIGVVLVGAFEFTLYMGWNIAPARFQVFPLTFIFGIQNAMSMAGAVGCPTSLCTGHVGVLAGAVQKLLAGQRAKIPIDKFAVSLAIILAFLLGAVSGQLAVRYTVESDFRQFLLLPAVVLLAVAMVVDDKLSTEEEEETPRPASLGSFAPLVTQP
uniref:DUF1275 domain-containing protein n=1 Tax=Zooxanthella nutricula TaxID=1333877 RepID=A0A7S2PV12_9DINO